MGLIQDRKPEHIHHTLKDFRFSLDQIVSTLPAFFCRHNSLENPYFGFGLDPQDSSVIASRIADILVELDEAKRAVHER